MAPRLRIRDDDTDWIAAVSGPSVTLADVAGAFAVEDLTDGRLRVTGPDGTFDAVGVITNDVAWVSLAGELFALPVGPENDRTHTGGRGNDALTPPMSATVIRVAVKAGAKVSQGDTLIVLEAMKMELPLKAPKDGVVRAINCREGDLVQPGTILVDLE